MGRVDMPTGAPPARRRGGFDIITSGAAVAALVWATPVVVTSGAAVAALVWAFSRRGELGVDRFGVVTVRSGVVGDSFPPVDGLRADPRRPGCGLGAPWSRLLACWGSAARPARGGGEGGVVIAVVHRERYHIEGLREPCGRRRVYELFTRAPWWSLDVP
jgi:hypothetical protein